MSSRRKLSAELQQQVRTRANDLCEYCHTSEQWQYVQFTIDHILPIAQGGTDNLDNLALACFYCNRRKTDKTTTIDPKTKQQVLLFNPRQDCWSDHFIWSADGLTIIGLTEIGQATIAALNLNRERVINIRAADKAVDRHSLFMIRFNLSTILQQNEPLIPLVVHLSRSSLSFAP